MLHLQTKSEIKEQNVAFVILQIGNFFQVMGFDTLVTVNATS